MTADRPAQYKVAAVLTRPHKPRSPVSTRQLPAAVPTSPGRLRPSPPRPPGRSQLRYAGCGMGRPNSCSSSTSPALMAWPAGDSLCQVPSVASFVLLDDARGDAPAVADRDGMVFGPGSDIGAALAACWGTAGPTLSPTRLAGMVDVGCELPAERLGVLGAQINLILRAVQPEPHRLIGRPAIKIVFERDGYIFCVIPASWLRSASCTVQDQLSCRGRHNAATARQLNGCIRPG
jgi:hypothetical protein